MLSHESCRIATTTESEQQDWAIQLHNLVTTTYVNIILDKYQLFGPKMKYHHSRSLENEVFD